jgi:AraC-like DNA-binding protein
MKAHLAIFLIELVRNRKNENSANVPVSPYAQQRLDEFMELLEVNVAHHKQVSYYADRLNLSNYQLNAIAKEMMGKTSSELIDEHIILESRRYLLGTSNQVNQIAHHLGFDDVSYFIRFFKKHTGYSPEAFRQNFG